MTTLVQFRVDQELKTEADALFKEMGLDLSTALKLFLKQTVNKRAIPFVITTADDGFYSKDNIAYLKNVIDEIDNKKAMMIKKSIDELEVLQNAKY